MTTWQDAVLAVLNAADPSSTVYDGHVPTLPARRYGVFYPTSGMRENTSVCGSARDGIFKFQVTTVVSDDPAAPGNVRKQCTWLATTYRDALIGVVITCDGWVCGPIEKTDDGFMRADDSLNDRSSVIAVDRYSIRADRTF